MAVTAQTAKSGSKKSSTSGNEDSFEQHFEAARELQAKGDSDRAAKEYKSYLVAALKSVANLRAHAREYKEAEASFQAAEALSPDDPDLLLDFAVARLDEDKFSEAKSLGEKALQISPENARAEYIIGNALCQQNDYAAAKPHLEAAVVGAPNFETGYLLGLTYLKLKDLKHAELLFADMIKGLGDSARLHMYFGRAYRNAGYDDRAVEELKKAVSIDPKEAQARYFLGLAYLARDGDAGLTEAEPEFRAELQRNANDYRSRYLLGYILTKQHNWSEAETQLSRSAALDPNNPDPLIYLGQVYGETERPQEAEKTLRRAIEMTKDPSRNNYQVNRAHYLLGRLLMQSGRRDEARKEMQISGELSKDAVELARKRVAGDLPNLSGEMSGQSTDANASSEEPEEVAAYVAKVKPAIADSYNNLGVIEAAKKNYGVALQYFRSAAQWEPSLETIDRNIGMASFYTNQFDEAAYRLRRHLQSHPDDARARGALALSLFGLERYQQVREMLQPVATDIASDPGLAYAYAVSVLKSGDYKQGIERLRELEKTNYRSVDLHSLLGQTFADQNDWAAALDEYRRASEVDPKLAHPHFLVGLALIHQGRPVDAVAELRRAVQLDPSDVASKYHLAFALIEVGKKDEALPLLQEVLHKDPQHGDAYYQLGKLQLERGDIKAAIVNLEAGTKYKPDGDYIHYQLAMAYRRDSRAEDAKRELKAYQALKERHRGRSPSQVESN